MRQLSHFSFLLTFHPPLRSPLSRRPFLPPLSTAFFIAFFSLVHTLDFHHIQQLQLAPTSSSSLSLLESLSSYRSSSFSRFRLILSFGKHEPSQTVNFPSRDSNQSYRPVSAAGLLIPLFPFVCLMLLFLLRFTRSCAHPRFWWPVMAKLRKEPTKLIYELFYVHVSNFSSLLSKNFCIS